MTQPNPLNHNGAARLLAAGEVADLLGVPKSWVYAETRAGRIPHVTLGRYRRYRVDAIEAWLTDRERGPILASGVSQRGRAPAAGHLTSDSP